MDKVFCLVRQYRVCKRLGFKFKQVSGYSNAKMLCPDTGFVVEIGKGLWDSAKQLTLEIRLQRAYKRRKAFKCISGGMAWVPAGLKISTPIAKLKLVKAA